MAGWKRAFVFVAFVLVILIVSCLVFRGTILRWGFSRAQSRIHEGYRASLTASSVEFAGLDHVTLKNIILVPDGADTLLRVAEADVRVSLVSLLRGKVVCSGINISGANFTIYNEPERNNFTFIRSAGRDRGTVSAPTTAGYREQAADWEARLFQILNTGFTARDIRISYQDTAHVESVYIPAFRYDLHTLSGIVINQKNADTISLDGEVLKKNQAYRCLIRNLGSDTIYLPFLDREHGLMCRFHSIIAELRFDNSGDACRIAGSATLEDFHIHHWRLAREDVVLSDAVFRGSVSFTDHAIEVDSSSMVTLGGASCRIYARYDLEPDTTFSLALHMPEIGADSFFQALPSGMFSTLRGMSCSGTLAYDLTFSIHTDNPDSLLFYSALRQKNLHVQHFGEDNYTRINAPFSYDAYDKDSFVRRIMIGPENPDFTPLAQISPYLPQAVLQAEDPSFMQHRGFYMEAFRESIAKNYKEHRFARGGSTISMQLVKNVFLSHDKTISRKAEEALIVYLIENLGLVPKERMLEVYLNVIEWGPNVYGIGEASRFYFGKRPSALSLQESLFLASIIPRPKSFQYEFDRDGQLRSSMGDYFKILSTRMVWRGVLEPADTVGLKPEVTLRGPALYMIMPRDTIITESEDAD